MASRRGKTARFEAGWFSKTSPQHANEDRAILLEEVQSEGQEQAVFGVFDGHGGADASKYAATSLVPIMLREPLFSERGQLGPALVRSIRQLNKQFCDISRKRDITSGACVLTAVLRGRKLVVANCGDCRAILFDPETNTIRELSRDHTAHVASERARIEALGGVVTMGRIFGVLEPSRSIGDIDVKDMHRNHVAATNFRKPAPTIADAGEGKTAKLAVHPSGEPEDLSQAQAQAQADAQSEQVAAEVAALLDSTLQLRIDMDTGAASPPRSPRSDQDTGAGAASTALGSSFDLGSGSASQQQFLDALDSANACTAQARISQGGSVSSLDAFAGPEPMQTDGDVDTGPGAGAGLFGSDTGAGPDSDAGMLPALPASPRARSRASRVRAIPPALSPRRTRSMGLESTGTQAQPTAAAAGAVSASARPGPDMPAPGSGRRSREKRSRLSNDGPPGVISQSQASAGPGLPSGPGPAPGPSSFEMTLAQQPVSASPAHVQPTWLAPEPWTHAPLDPAGLMAVGVGIGMPRSGSGSRSASPAPSDVLGSGSGSGPASAGQRSVSPRQTRSMSKRSPAALAMTTPVRNPRAATRGSSASAVSGAGHEPRLLTASEPVTSELTPSGSEPSLLTAGLAEAAVPDTAAAPRTPTAPRSAPMPTRSASRREQTQAQAQAQTQVPAHADSADSNPITAIKRELADGNGFGSSAPGSGGSGSPGSVARKRKRTISLEREVLSGDEACDLTTGHDLTMIQPQARISSEGVGLGSAAVSEASEAPTRAEVKRVRGRPKAKAKAKAKPKSKARAAGPSVLRGDADVIVVDSSDSEVEAGPRTGSDEDDEVVSSTAEVLDCLITPGSILILATDGVWDVMGNQEVVNVVRTLLVPIETEQAGGRKTQAGRAAAARGGKDSGSPAKRRTVAVSAPDNARELSSGVGNRAERAAKLLAEAARAKRGNMDDITALIVHFGAQL